MSIPPPCERIDCRVNVPCTNMTYGAWDPLHQPTTVSCYVPACDRCVCQWVAAGPDVAAAGQSLTATAYVGCGVGFWGTFTPAPVNTDAPVCVSLHAAGSPAVGKILASILVEPICAKTDCSFPPSGLGGVVGEAVTLVEQLATIWCQAAKAAAGVASGAVIATCDATMAFVNGGSCPA
jgi:hypothetical protein